MKSSIIPAHGRTWREIYNEIERQTSNPTYNEPYSPKPYDPFEGMHAIVVYDLMTKTTYTERLSIGYIQDCAIKEFQKSLRPEIIAVNEKIKIVGEENSGLEVVYQEDNITEIKAVLNNNFPDNKWVGMAYLDIDSLKVLHSVLGKIINQYSTDNADETK